MHSFTLQRLPVIVPALLLLLPGLEVGAEEQPPSAPAPAVAPPAPTTPAAQAPTNGNGTSKGPAGTAETSTITVVGQGSSPFAVGLGGSALQLPLPEQQLPQSLTNLTKDNLEARADFSLHDALLNVPGLTVAAGEGRTTGDQFYIRGFPATTDIYLDGIRDNGYYLRDTFNVADVEILRGPSALLFGPGATGGAVNLITQKPTSHWTGDVEASAGSYGMQRLQAGAGGPLFGSMLGGRLDAFEEYGHNFRDDTWTSYGVAPTLSTHFDTGTTVSAQLVYQHYDGSLDYGIPFLNGRPAPVPITTYYGSRDDDFQRSNDLPATISIEQTLGSNVTVTSSTRLARYDRLYRADIPVQVVYPAETEVARQFLNDNLQKNYDNVTELHGHFKINDHELNLVAGAEEGWYDYQYQQTVSTGLPTIPVLDPDFPITEPGRADSLSPPFSVLFHSKTTLLSGYAVASYEFIDHWQAVLGGREDNYGTAYYAGSGANPPVYTELTQTDTHFSPRAGLIYSPSDRLSFYASYTTSFDPSSETYTLSAATSVLPPEQTRDYEIGVKGTVGDSLALFADAFDEVMYNARTTNTANPQFQSLAGTQRTTGLEAGGQGNLTHGWFLDGGIAWYDSRITESNSTTANDYNVAVPLQGKTPISTPKLSGTLWVTYQFDLGLYAGAGMQAQSAVFADAANTNVIPGYYIVNAMIGYAFDAWQTRWHAQVNVNNLFNRTYYQGASQNNPFSVMPGSPLTAVATLGARF